MKNILWLPSWYPHEEDPLVGDFIERHAKAASLFNSIVVLFVVKDCAKTAAKRTVKETIRYNEYFTAYVYYYRPSSSVQWLESFLSAITYFRLYVKLIKEYLLRYGKPDLVHVHVAFRAGLMALYLKWRYGFRYVITEHWSVFLPAAKPSLGDKPFPVRALLRLIYKNASACMAVGRYLATSVAGRMSIREPIVIPNVVDRHLFFPEEKQPGVFRFVHVSQLNYAKNAEQIMEAIDILRGMTVLPFRLTVYGPWDIALQMIETRGLQDIVDLEGEVPQPQLAAALRRHDALVMYSRFEGCPCVVIEANASGLPVITSDIPAMREIVEEGISGLFVALENPALLADSMLWMMYNRDHFDSAALARRAMEKYGFETVGKQFDEFYRSQGR